MQNNKLTIRIDKPVAEVFLYCITPPNSTKWIDAVTNEETSDWPVRMGTIYKLHLRNGKDYEVEVTAIKDNKMVEWKSKIGDYHCRYTFKPLTENITEMEYFEWVDQGELDGPFTLETLKRLKSAIEL